MRKTRKDDRVVSGMEQEMEKKMHPGMEGAQERAQHAAWVF